MYKCYECGLYFFKENFEKINSTRVERYFWGGTIKKQKNSWQQLKKYSIILIVTRRSQNFSPYPNKEKG